ncbi:hypothetical protein [Asticcacaulis endophyticus]|uniref:Uncharacterized protein n=1 Tax=Asticcacaulis endophyticus TaxID=1395890 RepID=A0A918UTF3_9CAUL|nr:hypothetical protein [Asticcacaulis endophyticus]GGZ31895.1 hypothetical protein GCM10011273_17380 [Asticcacaulis endophyticus]
MSKEDAAYWVFISAALVIICITGWLVHKYFPADDNDDDDENRLL